MTTYDFWLFITYDFWLFTTDDSEIEKFTISPELGCRGGPGE